MVITSASFGSTLSSTRREALAKVRCATTNNHSGRAVDPTTPGASLLETDFENTSAFRWLENDARHFAFHFSYPGNDGLGYEYGPWHRCFDTARSHDRWTGQRTSRNKVSPCSGIYL
ncbi:D-alanyl-D-alanine carboxypeptidase family protein [Azotobacter vinelandii]|uniref:D-alanyl-D-alanine carboxypeptidase family protein n=1 Tax=Azotobacter vinelandii TaxID=354 RepID=UPI00345DDE8D